MTATVSAKTIRAALEAARTGGVDVSALARAHGLTAALEDLDARFPHEAWIALWRHVIEVTGDDAIGLRTAEQLAFGHFGVIDYLISASPDLETALARFERYFALVSTGVAHVLERHGREVHLVRRYAPGHRTRLLAPAEFAFTNIVLRTRIAAGNAYRPREVRFAASAPRDIGLRRRTFDCPVVFDALESAIVFDETTLSIPMRCADTSLLSVLEAHAKQLSSELARETPHADIVSRTRGVLLDGMKDADVSATRAARRLGVSVRTLQRKLGEQGLSFDRMLDSLRHELARRYLSDPSLSIDEVSFLLAFGHTRGFYRAFHRWERCTPAAYRARGVVAPEARTLAS